MGFFDRFYYGKAGKADYTVEDMPKNRLQLFFRGCLDHPEREQERRTDGPDE